MSTLPIPGGSRSRGMLPHWSPGTAVAPGPPPEEHVAPVVSHLPWSRRPATANPCSPAQRQGLCGLAALGVLRGPGFSTIHGRVTVWVVRLVPARAAGLMESELTTFARLLCGLSGPRLWSPQGGLETQGLPSLPQWGRPSAGGVREVKLQPDGPAPQRAGGLATGLLPPSTRVCVPCSLSGAGQGHVLASGIRGARGGLSRQVHEGLFSRMGTRG